MSIALTHRQRLVLLSIQEYADMHDGVMPSRSETAKATGMVRSNVSRVIDALCERGYLMRLSKLPRALAILIRLAPRDEPDFVGRFIPSLEQQLELSVARETFRADDLRDAIRRAL